MKVDVPFSFYVFNVTYKDIEEVQIYQCRRSFINKSYKKMNYINKISETRHIPVIRAEYYDSFNTFSR